MRPIGYSHRRRMNVLESKGVYISGPRRDIQISRNLYDKAKNNRSIALENEEFKTRSTLTPAIKSGSSSSQKNNFYLVKIKLDSCLKHLLEVNWEVIRKDSDAIHKKVKVAAALFEECSTNDAKVEFLKHLLEKCDWDYPSTEQDLLIMWIAALSVKGCQLKEQYRHKLYSEYLQHFSNLIKTSQRGSINNIFPQLLTLKRHFHNFFGQKWSASLPYIEISVMLRSNKRRDFEQLYPLRRSTSIPAPLDFKGREPIDKSDLKFMTKNQRRRLRKGSGICYSNLSNYCEQQSKRPKPEYTPTPTTNSSCVAANAGPDINRTYYSVPTPTPIILTNTSTEVKSCETFNNHSNEKLKDEGKQTGDQYQPPKTVDDWMNFSKNFLAQLGKPTVTEVKKKSFKQQESTSSANDGEVVSASFIPTSSSKPHLASAANDKLISRTVCKTKYVSKNLTPSTSSGSYSSILGDRRERVDPSYLALVELQKSTPSKLEAIRRNLGQDPSLMPFLSKSSGSNDANVVVVDDKMPNDEFVDNILASTLMDWGLVKQSDGRFAMQFVHNTNTAQKTSS